MKISANHPECFICSWKRVSDVDGFWWFRFSFWFAGYVLYLLEKIYLWPWMQLEILSIASLIKKNSNQVKLSVFVCCCFCRCLAKFCQQGWTCWVCGERNKFGHYWRSRECKRSYWAGCCWNNEKSSPASSFIKSECVICQHSVLFSFQLQSSWQFFIPARWRFDCHWWRSSFQKRGRLWKTCGCSTGP